MRALASHPASEVEYRYWVALQIERLLYSAALLMASRRLLQYLITAWQGGLS